MPGVWSAARPHRPTRSSGGSAERRCAGAGGRRAAPTTRVIPPSTARFGRIPPRPAPSKISSCQASMAQACGAMWPTTLHRPRDDARAATCSRRASRRRPPSGMPIAWAWSASLTHEPTSRPTAVDSAANVTDERAAASGSPHVDPERHRSRSPTISADWTSANSELGHADPEQHRRRRGWGWPACRRMSAALAVVGEDRAHGERVDEHEQHEVAGRGVGERAPRDRRAPSARPSRTSTGRDVAPRSSTTSPGRRLVSRRRRAPRLHRALVDALLGDRALDRGEGGRTPPRRPGRRSRRPAPRPRRGPRRTRPGSTMPALSVGGADVAAQRGLGRRTPSARRRRGRRGGRSAPPTAASRRGRARRGRSIPAPPKVSPTSDDDDHRQHEPEHHASPCRCAAGGSSWREIVHTVRSISGSPAGAGGARARWRRPRAAQTSSTPMCGSTSTTVPSPADSSAKPRRAQPLGVSSDRRSRPGGQLRQRHQRAADDAEDERDHRGVEVGGPLACGRSRRRAPRCRPPRARPPRSAPAPRPGGPSGPRGAPTVAPHSVSSSPARAPRRRGPCRGGSARHRHRARSGCGRAPGGAAPRGACGRRWPTLRKSHVMHIHERNDVKIAIPGMSRNCIDQFVVIKNFRHLR